MYTHNPWFQLLVLLGTLKVLLLQRHTVEYSFLAHFPYFEKMKVCLFDDHSVCLVTLSLR
jgi:hypothetical protein